MAITFEKGALRRRIAAALFGGIVLGLGAANAAGEDAKSEKDKARDAIWAKEQSIYKGRAKGGLQFYLDNAAEEYVGWPPTVSKPLALSALRQSSASMAGQNQEQLTMNFMDFTLHGDTGIIYYMNHRTVKPDGTQVDEKWETIHVWVREGDDWKIVGAMARIEPKRGG
ncbi:MAG: nuclear transport factor 2 family protein [Rhodobacteraceae bacterium]|nr:nuclear transport factor 2 family protein [Paracoccaceae bacterium]